MALEITSIICGSFVFIVLAVLFTAVAMARKVTAAVPPSLDEIFESATAFLDQKGV